MRLRHFLERESWLFGFLVAALVVVSAIGYSRIAHEPPPLIESEPKIVLPAAPREILPMNPCPEGWAYSPGVIPPDVANNSHTGARSFYVCRKSGTEVTVFDNGDVIGYDQMGQALTREQAIEALKK